MWEGGQSLRSGCLFLWVGNGFILCSRCLGRKAGHVTPGARSLVPLVCVAEVGGVGSGVQPCVHRLYRQTYVGQLREWMHCWRLVRGWHSGVSLRPGHPCSRS